MVNATHALSMVNLIINTNLLHIFWKILQLISLRLSRQLKLYKIKIKTNKRSKQMTNNKQGKKVTITQIRLKFSNNHSRRLRICFQRKIYNLEVLRWRSWFSILKSIYKLEKRKIKILWVHKLLIILSHWV